METECVTSLFGNAQTFVGVLVTLIVLCLFNDKSNFLLNLISKFNDDMHKYMNECSSSLKNTIKGKLALQGQGISRMDFWMKQGDEKLKANLLEFQSNAQITENKFYNVCKQEIGVYEQKTKALENKSELMFIEFHLFVLSVLLMLIDACFEYSPFWGVFTYLIVIMSGSFTFTLWYNYLTDREASLSVEYPRSLVKSNWMVLGRIFGKLLTISLFVFLVLMMVACLMHLSVVIVTAMSVSLFVLAIIHSNIELKKMHHYKYNTRFVARHTFVQFFASGLVTMMMFALIAIFRRVGTDQEFIVVLVKNFENNADCLLQNNCIGLVYAFYLLLSCFLSPLLVGYYINRRNARKALTEMRQCYIECVGEAEKNAEEYRNLIDEYVDEQSQKKQN